MITAKYPDAPGTVELQLLRSGPAHNQLLSPLTEYFALCGEHTNASLRIPLEHRALLTRLRALQYGDSEATRLDQLSELSRIASDVLAKVPGLIADLAAHRASGKPYVHLSIASRASELALFPFELAISPDGFPGAGQAALLQQQLPICLTRRSKNVRNEQFAWDRPVRILMIASSAGGDIPVREHYATLRKLVEPWVVTRPSDSTTDREKKLGRVLKLLDQATIRDIERTLREDLDPEDQPFTHIHVLAHGCRLPQVEERYGLAFHGPNGDGIDAVDGIRLAKALACRRCFPTSSRRQPGPAVVTVAACDSSHQGDVTLAASSVAFDLHDSGIPLVVGSQFPLSVPGSLVMTEAVYAGLLEGKDPRAVLWEMHRALRTRLPELPGGTLPEPGAPHDWASVTAYAAFPDDLNETVLHHRRTREKARVDAHLRTLLKLSEEILARTRGELPNDGRRAVINDDERDLLAQDFRRVHELTVECLRAFEVWVLNPGNQDAESQITNLGILASAQKQLGLLSWQGAELIQQRKNSGEEQRQKLLRIGERHLRKSRETYWKVFHRSRNESWALTQALALNLMLSGDFHMKYWTTARFLGEFERNASDRKRQIWALAVLVELAYLGRLRDALHLRTPNYKRPIDVIEYLIMVRELHTEFPDEVVSAKRQFQRYRSHFIPACLKLLEQDKGKRKIAKNAADAKRAAAALRAEDERIARELELLSEIHEPAFP